MNILRFAVIGTGFWSHYQIAAWKEIPGVELVALYNRNREKAVAVARMFEVPAVYDDAEELMDVEKPDFVDIITNVETHAKFTMMALERGIRVICQKPMATSLDEARLMVGRSRECHTTVFIHENFRFQSTIRALKEIIDSGIIGNPFKARISFCSGFPVFENQPALADLPNFILTDIGSHILDICRFLFGEARTLYALTKKVNKGIKGEDVANVLMEMQNGLHCYAEMSYASYLEKESFPATLALVEGDQGSVELTHDYLLKITTRNGGTSSIIRSPPGYSWADPNYALAHSAIVDCNKDILNGLRGKGCEVTAEDNLKTVELVWSAYKSAESGNVIIF